MSSAGSQFLLLLWKNFKLQGRKKVVTTFEIIVPLFFALLLLVIRALSSSEYISTDTHWDRVYPRACVNITKTKIFYTPNNSFTNSLIQSIGRNNNNFTVVSFSSEDQLVYDWNLADNKDVWAAIVFLSDTSNGAPLSLSYKLRVALRSGKEDDDKWQTGSTYQFFASFGYRNNDSTGGEPYYHETGFLCLQYYISTAFIKAHGATANATEVALKKMLYPSFLKDVLTTVLQTNLPLFLVLSFILNALQISKDIAYEKEKKLKESMKMMGLSTSMYWISWFVKCLIYLVLVIVVYTILFSIEVGSKGKILNYTQPSLFFCFLLCYVLATIAFCFMISTFFRKANTAAFAGGILFFMTYFPYFFLVNYYETMTQSQKLAVSLLHNVGMAFGVNTMLIYEGTGDGAQWNNFYSPGTIDDNFCLLDAMAMLLADTVIYMLIAWYVDAINPGDAGVAQPPWFPFLPSYWCGSKVNFSLQDTKADGSVDSQCFERDPVGAKVGISIRHLRKVFTEGLLSRCKQGNKEKVAVDDTTLNMFEGQITSLLGHNGAGKTTTISMLTGFLKPSSGTAIVNGYDIRTDITNVRKKLGLCPQHNILFDLLTVEEHLQFFAQLKGCDRKNLKAEVEEMITVLGLQQKRHAQSFTLSGGQKRKLSVGIALIADSKIVILDEPTSGMDPAARRQTWEILQKYRKDRTIILTTHFMDEADILGDRIAIMADGVVKCSGSSMFLKKLYGAGYHMVMVKGKSCDVDHLTKLIHSHIPTATLESQISAEISYLLPFNETNKFEKLFLDIETNMQTLGVNSFGISATTMEEVFLKVGEAMSNNVDAVPNVALTKVKKQAFEEKSRAVFETPIIERNGKLLPITGHQNDVYKNVYQNDAFSKSSLDTVVALENLTKNYATYNKDIKKNTGMVLACQQFYGMFLKKFIHTKRNIAVAAAQLILPVVFTIGALAIAETLPSVSNEVSLNLDLSPFTNYVPAYSNGTLATNNTTKLATSYNSLFSSRATYVDRSKYAEMDDFFKATMSDIGVATFNRRYIVAGDFSETNGVITATAHYNGQPYHSIAIALNEVMNALLKTVINDTLSINVVNHPLPKKISNNDKSVSNSVGGTGFTIAISILFGMAFMATSFIIFLIRERSVGAKHLQVVSGVGPFAYWLSTFVWDIINYTIPVLLTLIVFAAFDTTEYTGNNRLGLVFFVFMLYGWSVLPFVYLFHYLFSVPATGMVVVSMINLCSGLVCLLATYVLSLPVLGTESIGKGLESFFVIFLPNYDLGLALMDIYTNSKYKTVCEEYNYEVVCARGIQMACCFPDNCGSTCLTFYNNFLTWQKPGVGRECVFMFLQGVVYFALVLLTEAGILRRIWSTITRSKSVSVGPLIDMDEPEDDDVLEESKRINSVDIESLSETDTLVLKNVNKVYDTGFHAVKGITCGVPKNECFGLLGQNGAGKTSTFKILTGDEQLTSGNAYLNQFSVERDIKKVQQNLGYCPQFDALIDQMTGRETLRMYARLRGIKESQIKDIVNQVIETLMLSKHADKQTGVYSGGNKRKLSTAIALIGDPPFIFLDEPTTGMDPRARRQLWNVLSDVRASGRTLILTSHSMEECDALCTRIVIMVNGKFVCLGSPQHLKNKFGHGYTLFCRMGFKPDGTVSSSTPLVDFIKSNFEKAEVFSDNKGYVHFLIPDENAKLAQVFGVMEHAKEQYTVEDYSVHQTTLEQIFLTFTQNQVPPKEKKKKSCWKKCCCCCCCCCK